MLHKILFFVALPFLLLVSGTTNAHNPDPEHGGRFWKDNYRVGGSN